MLRQASAWPRSRCGDAIGTQDVGIADDLEVLVVVRGEQGNGEEGLAMVAKVGRDIADPQAANRRTVVEMGLDELGQGRGVPLVPSAVFFVECPGIVAGAEKLGVDQVAVRLGLVRL